MAAQCGAGDDGTHDHQRVDDDGPVSYTHLDVYKRQGGHFGSLHASAHTRNETLAQLVNITAGANELTLLEEQYRQGKITSALCFRLLEAYRQAEELSDAQKELQQDAVVQLAAAQLYSGAAQEETGLSPSAVERLLAGRAQVEVQYNCADLISWAQAGDCLLYTSRCV